MCDIISWMLMNQHKTQQKQKNINNKEENR